MPDDLFAYAEQARGRVLAAIIAGAGGAAHLPGMLAAKTTVPVLGVPVASKHLSGVDSLHSIVQMPKGVPVATLRLAWRRGQCRAVRSGHAPNADAVCATSCSPGARGRPAARAMSPSSAAGRVMPAQLPGAAGPDGRPALLGVMGGGQLARMFVHAAQAMGYGTAVLDVDAASPAGRVSHLHVRTAYDDPQGLATLAGSCAAITTEFENVPAPSLAWLAVQRPVAPGAQAGHLPAACGRKGDFQRCGVPCAPFAVLDSADDMARLDAALFPGILKTTQLGYDGKGQIGVAAPEGLAAAWDTLGRVPCVLERRLALRLEISVIVARAAGGQIVHLPVQQNLHRDGILAVTQVPAPDMPPGLAAEAVARAGRIAESMEYVGVLCVEFFVLEDGSLVANEMAPRPHNSGHYSIDACDVSQFELQVRCLAGLPLVAPRQHSAAVMLNLLGDLWFAQGKGVAVSPPWDRVLALPGVHLHLYGKAEARPGRKMGHLTITAADAVDAARHRGGGAAQAARLLNTGATAPCHCSMQAILQALISAARHLASGELLAFPTETVYGLGGTRRRRCGRAKDLCRQGAAGAASADRARGGPRAGAAICGRVAAIGAETGTGLLARAADAHRAAPARPGRRRGGRAGQHRLARACASGGALAAARGAEAGRGRHRCAQRQPIGGQRHPYGAWSRSSAPGRVLDGGECPGGIESAIVDYRGAAALLRPDCWRAQIEAALGQALREPDAIATREQQQPRAAPNAAAADAHQLREAVAILADHSSSLKLAVYSRSDMPKGRGIEHRRMPDNAAEAAHELFAVLREFDAQGAQLIWIEQPPPSTEWEGVLDRLQRAAAA
jgi:5-(carboxyamino)imidazole ribonucleotide synthase